MIQSRVKVFFIFKFPIPISRRVFAYPSKIKALLGLCMSLQRLGWGDETSWGYIIYNLFLRLALFFFFFLTFSSFTSSPSHVSSQRNVEKTSFPYSLKLNISCSPCQEGKALAVLCPGHFSELSLQQVTLRVEAMSLSGT